MQATQTYMIEKYDNERDWGLARLTLCGSSNAAAIVGVDRTRGLYATWAEKTSPLQVREQDELCYWGHALEKPIFQRFLEELDGGAFADYAQDPGEYSLFRSTLKSWHGCTPDRLLVTTEGVIPVELKTAHYEQARVWAKEVPWSYIVQVHWQMHVLDAQQAYIAVLCNGRDFQYHPIRRNEEIIQRLVKRVDKFWRDHVLTRVAPPVDANQSTREWLASIYSQPKREVAELIDDEFADIGERYDKLSRLSSKIDKAKTLVQNRIKERMGDCELAILGDGSGFSWAGNKSRRFTRKRKVYLDEN